MLQPLLTTVERPLDEVINVSAVPHRSPFRYPGGKTWFVPRIRQWLARLPHKPKEFIEPFAGGAIVGLTVAFERLAEHVIIVELDHEVAAVWHTILGNDGEWLADRVGSFHMTWGNLEEELAREPRTVRDLAFQTVLRNRTAHGGIMAPGAGKVKNGEKGRGLTSRWYPSTLRRRIREIVRVKDRISFIEGDGLEIIRGGARDKDAVFFIDPPYTAAGKKAGTRLYNHFELDHERLFTLAAGVAGDFLMTYDDARELRELAARHGLDNELVAMTNTHHAKMSELLIGRNLDWCRRS